MSASRKSSRARGRFAISLAVAGCLEPLVHTSARAQDECSSGPGFVEVLRARDWDFMHPEGCLPGALAACGRSLSLDVVDVRLSGQGTVAGSAKLFLWFGDDMDFGYGTFTWTQAEGAVPIPTATFPVESIVDVADDGTVLAYGSSGPGVFIPEDGVWVVPPVPAGSFLAGFPYGAGKITPDGRFVLGSIVQASQLKAVVWDLQADPIVPHVLFQGFSDTFQASGISDDGSVVLGVKWDVGAAVWSEATDTVEPLLLTDPTVAPWGVRLSGDGKTAVGLDPAQGYALVEWDLTSAPPFTATPLTSDYFTNAVLNYDGTVVLGFDSNANLLRVENGQVQPATQYLLPPDCWGPPSCEIVDANADLSVLAGRIYVDGNPEGWVSSLGGDGVDDSPPTIQVTATPIQLELDASCQALVPDVWAYATVEDNCSEVGDIETDQDPAAGYLVEGPGSLDGTLSATDEANQTGYADFTVSAEDLASPEVTCPPDLVVGTNPDQCLATVDYDDPTVDDNCPGATVVCDVPDGDFPLGTTAVNCTAIDASSNTSSCSFYVTVEDQQAPTVGITGVSPNSLWPSDLRYVAVTTGLAWSDNCGGPITVEVTARSSQPDGSGPFTLDTNNDDGFSGPVPIAVVNSPGNGAANVGAVYRAEATRGRSSNDACRVYTETAIATDHAGNTSAAALGTIIVPHDQGGGSCGTP